MKKSTFPHEQFLPSILHHIQDGIVLLDSELAVVYMNPAAERMSSLNCRDVRGRGIHHAFSLLESQDLSPLFPAISAGTGRIMGNRVTADAEWSIRFRNAVLKSRHGVTLFVEGNISRFPLAAGSQMGYIIIFRNTAERKRISAVADYRPHYDLLTGFSNREGLTLQLKKILEELENQDIKHTLLGLEIDRFGKIINEAGMPGAEDVLKQFALILRSQIQQEDIAVRLSEDTFIFMLRNCSIRDAIHVAGRINMAVSNHVFKYRGLELPLSVSMGMVALPGGKRNMETLLRSAKTACNRAKQEGRRKPDFPLYMKEQAAVIRLQDIH
jgi:diguanylate cyclase (GGDEF)-like protein/PAS domain S-box-containing protein